MSPQGPAETPELDAPAAPSPRRARWLPWLFGLLCLLSLAPIWSVTYLPTTDGPSHLYNSWILKQIGNIERYPLFAATYEVVLRPVPNWLCYAVTYLLLFVAPPLIAEKLLVTAIILVELFGFWYLAGAVGRDRQWLAFFGFAFVFSVLFQFGFWNFCFSVGFFMLAVGYWWRRRHQPDLRTGLTLNGILLLCYFSHILSTDLALFSIAVLWLCTLERGSWRRHLMHVPLLAPQALLPLWFMLGHGGSVVPASTAVHQQLHYLFNLQVLLAFRHVRPINGWVALAFALLILLTLADRSRGWLAPAPFLPQGEGRPSRRRLVRQEDGFLLLAILLGLVYVISPDAVAGGSILKPRLALYPCLVLIPWLSVRLAAPARAVAVAALATLGLVNLWQAWDCYRQMDPILTAYVQTLDRVAPNSRILPLYFDHPGFCVRLPIIGHTIDYAAIDKGLIDWDNYEAGTDLFPLRFLPPINRRRPDIYTIEAAPDRLRVHQYSGSSDYILSWGMPANAPVRQRILRYYDQIFARGPVDLFARQPAAGAVRSIVRTLPGSVSERRAAELLPAGAAACGPPRAGSTTQALLGGAGR